MRVTLVCGCTVDDGVTSTVHHPDGHYPLGATPKTFCKKCDLYRPCLCAQIEVNPYLIALEKTGRLRDGSIVYIDDDVWIFKSDSHFFGYLESQDGTKKVAPTTLSRMMADRVAVVKL